MASFAGPDCSAHSAPPCTAIAAEETLGPVAGAGTISQISEIRKILEIATGLKMRFHILKITMHLARNVKGCHSRYLYSWKQKAPPQMRDRYMILSAGQLCSLFYVCGIVPSRAPRTSDLAKWKKFPPNFKYRKYRSNDKRGG